MVKTKEICCSKNFRSDFIKKLRSENVCSQFFCLKTLSFHPLPHKHTFLLLLNLPNLLKQKLFQFCVLMSIKPSFCCCINLSLIFSFFKYGKSKFLTIFFGFSPLKTTFFDFCSTCLTPDSMT